MALRSRSWPPRIPPTRSFDRLAYNHGALDTNSSGARGMRTMSEQQPLTRSTPEAQGVDSRGVLAFLDSLEGASFQLHSLMIVRRGRVVVEGWWRPFAPGHRRYLYSLSKSFTSTGIGLAVADGLLSVDDRVVDFFVDDLPTTVSPNLAAMRVRDLLTMSTGHAEDTTPALFAPGVTNWVRAILALPVDYRPGERFVYNSGASYLLAAIIQRRTGRMLLDFLTERLLTPLGITGAIWDVCPQGVNTGGWGLSLSTEDIARFGQLYLQRGRWNGVQLLPESWVDEATGARVRNDGDYRAHEPIDWRQGYGYQFWRCRHGAYRGDGAFGQYGIVLPEQEAVIAITSEAPDMQAVLDRVWAHLLPAMTPADAVPTSPDAARLAERLATLEVTAPASPSPARPSPDHLGRVFQFQPNRAGLASVRIEATSEACRVSLVDSRGAHSLIGGYAAWIANRAQLPIFIPTLIHLGSGASPTEPLDLFVWAAWQDAHTLVLTLQYREIAHHETLTFRISADALRLELGHSVADPANPMLAGRELVFEGMPQA